LHHNVTRAEGILTYHTVVRAVAIPLRDGTWPWRVAIVLEASPDGSAAALLSVRGFRLRWIELAATTRLAHAHELGQLTVVCACALEGVDLAASCLTAESCVSADALELIKGLSNVIYS
jgi:hypothetical protein